MNARYRRLYEFGLSFDLTSVDGGPFRYEHIGGPERFYAIKDFFSERFGMFDAASRW
jgi:hypothetical protein